MQKRNLTKEKIMQAAFSLSDEIGLNQLSFPKLAETLNIKYPSLYNHFDNMDCLKREMTVYLLNNLNMELMQKMVGKSGKEAIREFADTYREFALANKTAYGLFINIPSFEDEESHALAKEITGIIRQILAFYIKDRTLLIHKSRAFRSLLHGFVSLNSSGYFKGEGNLDESFKVMIEDFIYSLSR